MKVVFNIAGMTCGGCAKSVARVLQEVAQVSEVEMDWQKGVATVTHNGASISALIEAVENAGFEVTSVEE